MGDIHPALLHRYAEALRGYAPEDAPRRLLTVLAAERAVAHERSRHPVLARIGDLIDRARSTRL